jgi:hypothetical protein
MKIVIKIGASLPLVVALIVTPCLSVQAQNAQAQPNSGINGEISSVDASSHAAVDVQPQASQPSQRVAKPPATFSSWSLQPVKGSSATVFWPRPTATLFVAARGAGANAATETSSTLNSHSFQLLSEPSAVTFWPADTTNFVAAPPRGDSSSKPSDRPIILHVLPAQRAFDGSARPSQFKTPVPPITAPSETRGFSSPFDRNPLTMDHNLSFPKAYSSQRQDRPKAQPHKLHPDKSKDGVNPAPDLDSPATKKH